MNKVTINTDFRSLMWEPLYQASERAIYNNEASSWDCGGGAGSGKTQIAHRIIITGLLKLPKHIALVYLYETEHKERIANLFETRLLEWNLPYKRKNSQSGTIKLSYGNDNEIHIMSIKGSSYASVEEKFKTPITDNKNVLYVWFEEFTAIFNVMKTQRVYSSAISRIKRQCRKGHVIMHTFNPPDSIADPIIDWRNKKSNVTHQLITDMYRLPKPFQDEETIKAAEELKKEDEQLWQNVYLGIVVGSDGLAFPNFMDNAVIDTVDSTIHEYEVYIDNGTMHATTFQLHGTTLSGQSILLDTYYHSGRLQGMKSSPEYIKDFKDFAIKHNINELDSIYTDDRDFALQLQAVGFKKAVWIVDEVRKDVAKSYRRCKTAIDKGVFKVLNTPNNNIVIQQFCNLTTTTKKYSDKYKVVPKKTESKDVPEKRTMHGVDPCLYRMLVKGKELGILDE